MASEESAVLNKTWLRSVDSVNKVGFMDGASDGQKFEFQSSFDMGLEQGLNFGFNLGYEIAQSRSLKDRTETLFQDPRNINCQICLSESNDNVVNLYNNQKEENDKFINSIIEHSELHLS